LRHEIESFFAAFNRVPGLEHLAHIKVEVLGWDDFEGVLAARPSLRFKWFHKLPAGLRPLRAVPERT